MITFNNAIARLVGEFGLTDDDREIWLTKVPQESRWNYHQADREDARFMRNLSCPHKS